MADQVNTAKQKHVLVVDDDVELAHTFQEVFQMHHYRASVSFDGVQALKFILDSDVDAVVCDLSMPQLEGDMFYNAIERVRPDLCQRFVFVTGNLGNPKYEPFLKRLTVPVLHKPIAMNALLGALNDVLSKSP